MGRAFFLPTDHSLQGFCILLLTIDKREFFPLSDAGSLFPSTDHWCLVIFSSHQSLTWGHLFLQLMAGHFLPQLSTDAGEIFPSTDHWCLDIFSSHQPLTQGNFFLPLIVGQFLLQLTTDAEKKNFLQLILRHFFLPLTHDTMCFFPPPTDSGASFPPDDCWCRACCPLLSFADHCLIYWFKIWTTILNQLNIPHWLKLH